MIHGIPTDKGLEVLNSELKNTATRYALVGDDGPTNDTLDRLIGRDPVTGQEAYTSDLEYSAVQNYIYHTASVDLVQFDENKALTFEINLGNLDTTKYLFACLLLGADDVVLAVIPLPKLILSAEVGGLLTIKFSIKGREPGQIVFLNRDFPSRAEWDVFKKTLSALFEGKAGEIVRLSDEMRAVLAQIQEQKSAFLQELDTRRAQIEAQQQTILTALDTKLEQKQAQILTQIAPDALAQRITQNITNSVTTGLDERIRVLVRPPQEAYQQDLNAKFEEFKRLLQEQQNQQRTDFTGQLNAQKSALESSINAMAGRMGLKVEELKVSLERRSMTNDADVRDVTLHLNNTHAGVFVASLYDNGVAKIKYIQVHANHTFFVDRIDRGSDNYIHNKNKIHADLFKEAIGSYNNAWRALQYTYIDTTFDTQHVYVIYV